MTALKHRFYGVLAVLLVVPVCATAAPPAMSVSDVMCRAKSAVGYSYWWGGSCWCASGCSGAFGSCSKGKCTPKSGSSGCPSCTHSGSYGADCSGFLYTVWRVGGLSASKACGPHGPVSGTYTKNTSNWTVVTPTKRQKGDSIAKSGHVMLFESSTSWGDHWVYEAKGCKYGIVHNTRSLSLGGTWKVARRKNLTGSSSPPPVVAKDPKMTIAVKSVGVADSRPEGSSKGIPDTFSGQTITMEIVVANKPGGKTTDDGVIIGYWFEKPYLTPLSYTIYSDWPAKDGKTWKVNDSNNAPGNPSKTSPPTSGKLKLYKMSPGETKKVVFKVKAAQYSIGKADHPDLRAWIWHVANYYGEQTAWNDKVEHNDAGKKLQAYQQLDVYSRLRWDFDATAAETEGWVAHHSVDTMKVNTSHHCLAAHMSGNDPILLSPKTSFKASKYKGIKLRARSHVGPVKGQIFYQTDASPKFTADKAVSFVAPGDGKFHDLTISMAGQAKWKGQILRLRVDPALKGTTWTDIDQLRMVGSVPVTSGDADKDGYLATPVGGDCSDKAANIHPGAKEICNGKDDDCDGKKDESLGQLTCGVGACATVTAACSSGKPAKCVPKAAAEAEACNGADDMCDGVIDASEKDQDSDGQLPCQGDCDDSDAGTYAGAADTCDGLDNDCDGQTDEGFDLGAPCTAGLGACLTNGVLECDGPGATRCSALPAEPAEELCDGLDNDCDGETDEDFGLGQACTPLGSQCDNQGTLACDANSQVVCVAPDGPGELCNGLDDDCNGIIDDGLPVGRACIAGQGVCARAGSWVCDEDGATICNVTQGLASAESCDALDNDCDGATDEGFPLGETCHVNGADCVHAGRWGCDAATGGVTCQADAACVPGDVVDSITSEGAPVDGAGPDVDPIVVQATPDAGCSAAQSGGRPVAGWLLLMLMLGLPAMRRQVL